MVNRVMISKQEWMKGSLLLFILLLLNVTQSYAIQLTDVEWQKRPLLLFAPQHDSIHLQETQQLLQQNSCDLDDREMIISIIVSQGTSSIDQKPISMEYATKLRNQFGVPTEEFAVLLLGKDGGEKYRRYQVPELDEIFSLIDGMPMRQDEMQDNPLDCRQ